MSAKTPRAPISAAPPKVVKPDPETFLDTLPGRQTAATASAGAAGGKPRTTAKNAATARKRPLADSLAEVERPPLPSDTPKPLLQRLAVDIPADLHATIKRVANRPGGSVRDDVAALLEWYYRGR